MVRIGGESYVFSSIDRLEEWIEKFVKVAANHDDMLRYFKARMDCPNPNPTELAEGFFRDGFRSMAYPNIFQGLNRHLQVRLKIMLSNALSAELDLGNTPYPYSMKGIIPMDLPISKPNFDNYTGEQAYPFKSTHELHTYLQAGVDAVVADGRMSKYYISRVKQDKPININFWRDAYRNVELNHPTIGEMQNNSRMHLLRALKCQLNCALGLEGKNKQYLLDYLVAPTTSTGRSIEQKTRDFAEAYGHSGLPKMGSDMDKKILESMSAGLFPTNRGAYFAPTMVMANVEELAKSIHAMPSSSDFFSRTTTEYKIKPTQVETKTMQIERPINVIGDYGSVNILTASEETLARLIREAQAKIEAGKDLAGISKAFAKKQADLEKIIDLCVKQLDKVAK